MKELFFDKPMMEEAQQWAENLGGINNSILKGRGNLAGRLGEIALARHLGVGIEDHKDYDMIHNGEKIEVKTKRRTVPPQYSYDVSVAATSTHQKPDRYAFISIEFEGKTSTGFYHKVKSIWLVGDMAADKYFKLATEWNRGDEDEANGFVTLVDMFNMRIGDLDNGL
jgi:hypothetical protein